MKYIKTYEKHIQDDQIDLIGYPEGNIITVTKEEFNLLKESITDLRDSVKRIETKIDNQGCR